MRRPNAEQAGNSAQPDFNLDDTMSALKSKMPEPTLTEDLMKTLTRFDQVSAAIMVDHVIAYADVTRPTVPELYRRYKADIDSRDESDGSSMALLSLNVFVGLIDSLDPVFVLSRRHGPSAVAKYRRKPRADTASIIRVSPPAHIVLGSPPVLAMTI